MTRYLVSRMAQTAFVLLLMSFVIYALIGLMPGDPIDVMVSANPDLTPEDAARLKALYGLHLPIHERYFNWLRAALNGELGYSRLFSQPVLDVLLPRLGNTAILMGASFGLSVLIAIPVGVYAAMRQNSLADHLVNLICFAGISLPSFALSLLLIKLFAVDLGWLPAGGIGTVGADSLWDRFTHLVLPVMALTIFSIGGYTRFMRGDMIGTLRADFIRTARAKGAGEVRVALGHALRNALIPVVTVIALQFGALFSGALIIETVFAYPGTGKLIYDAILGNDFNLALVGLLFATLMTLLSNLAADIVYAALDPRITYGEEAI